MEIWSKVQNIVLFHSNFKTYTIFTVGPCGASTMLSLTVLGKFRRTTFCDTILVWLSSTETPYKSFNNKNIQVSRGNSISAKRSQATKKVHAFGGRNTLLWIIQASECIWNPRIPKSRTLFRLLFKEWQSQFSLPIICVWKWVQKYSLENPWGEKKSSVHVVTYGGKFGRIEIKDTFRNWICVFEFAVYERILLCV